MEPKSVSKSLTGSHGPTVGVAPDPGFITPSPWEVDEAIEAAAAEFAVPTELLQVMAWVDSRYEHIPSQVSADGRAGLFQIDPSRLAVASDFLELSEDTLIDELDEHARAMAFLLAATAPSPSTGGSPEEDDLSRRSQAPIFGRYRPIHAINAGRPM